MLDSAMPRLFHPNVPGNTVFYLVPGTDGSTVPGERLVNWGAYVAMPAEEVTTFMIDQSGIPLIGSIPPGQMQPDQEDALKALMAAELPDFYADVVARTVDTSAQLIYTARIPAYHRGHMLLVGDAGSIAPPFTGSGVFKGYYNVSGLIDSLRRHPDLEVALSEWDAMQVQLANGLLALGEQMEKALIWNPLDLATADATSTDAWWSAAVTYPKYFDLESHK